MLKGEIMKIEKISLFRDKFKKEVQKRINKYYNKIKNKIEKISCLQKSFTFYTSTFFDRNDVAIEALYKVADLLRDQGFSIRLSIIQGDGGYIEYLLIEWGN